jgi:hypothetical protein
MFPGGNSHAVLASNQEAIFGLENVVNKRLFVTSDMPSTMRKTLDSALLQSMISGESINVPRKGKQAITIAKWPAHLLFGSNFLPDYPDASGAISRRFAIIPYETVVQKRDPCLHSKIKSTELVTVLLRCIRSYRSFLDVHLDHDILTLLPEICKLESSKAQVALDPLREFLESGNQYMMIRKKVDSEVTWQRFNQEFQKFANDKYSKGTKLTDSDKVTLTSCGYRVSEVSICKECNQLAIKANCGDHYDVNNRRRKVVIKNMEICMKSEVKYTVNNLGSHVPNAFYQHLSRKNGPS